MDFAIFNIQISYNIARKAMGSVERLLDLNGMTARDYRTTERRIKRKTGVTTTDYNCCVNSCFCYPISLDLDKCPSCNEPWWITNPGNQQKIPCARFQYIPVLPRIKLQMAHPKRAVAMTKYRKYIGKKGYTVANLKNVNDWWNAKLCKDLQDEQGILKNDTDIAFQFSTDGVKIFKTRSDFSVWPLLLINLNLPPKQRLELNNMMLVGVIPGPKNPENIDSFLEPLVQEFESLGEGCLAYNGSTNRVFSLRAYLVTVTADQVAREKLMGK